jgi:hypothetical protein
MTKRLLSFLALSMCFFSLSAQQPKVVLQKQLEGTSLIKSGSLLSRQSLKPSFAPQREGTDMDSLSLHYWDVTDKLSSIGVQSTGAYEVAFYEPDMTSLKGNQITSIFFFCQGVNISGIKVWVRKSLTGSDVASQAVSTVASDGNYSVKLSTPYTLDGDPLYIGYSFTVDKTSTDKDNYPVVVSSTTTVADGLYLLFGGNWYNAVGGSYGDAVIAAKVKGTSMPKNKVTLSSVDPKRAIAGSEAEISGTLMNNGVNVIHHVDVTYKLASKEYTQNVALADTLKTYGAKGSFSFKITAPEAGRYRMITSIPKVNDATNSMTGTITSHVTTMTTAFPRISVMEEGTGTWCGWCPRGMTGIKKMEAAHPTTFIPIAMHSGSDDPFTTSTYKALLDELSDGVPSCFIDRTYMGDPYYGLENGIEEMFQLANQIPAEGTISLACKYTDDSKKAITVTSASTINLPSKSILNPYRVAYVVLENGLTDTQTNYYNKATLLSNGYTEADIASFPQDVMADWGDKAASVENCEYDHVARGIYDVTGVANSLAGSFNAGDVLTHTMDITLPTTILNKDNVVIVAMLLDKETGEIVNATSGKLTDLVTAISTTQRSHFAATVSASKGCITVTADKARAEVYSADGRLLVSEIVNGSARMAVPSFRGVCIVRVMNGNNVIVKKVEL